MNRKSFCSFFLTCNKEIIIKMQETRTIEDVRNNLLYKNAEERDVIKQYFSNNPHIDQTKRTIIFSTPSETR